MEQSSETTSSSVGCHMCMESLQNRTYCTTDHPNDRLVKCCVECLSTWLSKHQVSVIGGSTVETYTVYSPDSKPVKTVRIGEPPPVPILVAPVAPPLPLPPPPVPIAPPAAALFADDFVLISTDTSSEQLDAVPLAPLAPLVPIPLVAPPLSVADFVHIDSDGSQDSAESAGSLSNRASAAFDRSSYMEAIYQAKKKKWERRKCCTLIIGSCFFAVFLALMGMAMGLNMDIKYAFVVLIFVSLICCVVIYGIMECAEISDIQKRPELKY